MSKHFFLARVRIHDRGNKPSVALGLSPHISDGFSTERDRGEVPKSAAQRSRACRTFSRAPLLKSACPLIFAPGPATITVLDCVPPHPAGHAPGLDPSPVALWSFAWDSPQCVSGKSSGRQQRRNRTAYGSTRLLVRHRRRCVLHRARLRGATRLYQLHTLRHPQPARLPGGDGLLPVAPGLPAVCPHGNGPGQGLHRWGRRSSSDRRPRSRGAHRLRHHDRLLRADPHRRHVVRTPPEDHEGLLLRRATLLLVADRLQPRGHHRRLLQLRQIQPHGLTSTGWQARRRI